jgi:hemerythrin-like domain-containing protein
MPITIGKKVESDYSNPLGLLSDCHRRIEQFLDVLIKVTSQARGAGLNEDQRQALEVALRYFREAAPKHTRDEEESLFPRMLASADERARSAIFLLDELHAEHELADAGHAEVEALGSRWLSEGVLSSESTDRLSELLDQLHSTYQKHIAAEDHDVFPLAGQILSSAELAAVGREMATRRSIDLNALESNLGVLRSTGAMKTSWRRDDSLIPLSREHQYALMLCLRIHRGLIEHDTDSKWLQMKADQAVCFFEGELAAHFQAEEEVLFPAMRELSGASRIINELLAEHGQMRWLIDQLRQIELSSLASTLKEFADFLEAHIRKEERELFPIYEQQASPETIVRVERAIFSLIGSASQPRNPELLR